MDATYHVVKDTTATSTDVRVLLPKMLLRYEQPEDFSQAPTFVWIPGGAKASTHLAIWTRGNSSPWIPRWPCGVMVATHSACRISRSTSARTTARQRFFPISGPAMILKASTSRRLQFYYSDADKGFSFNISVTDALISFKGEVWLEAELDLLFDQARIRARTDWHLPKFLNGNQPIKFNASTPVDGQKDIYQGGSITAPANVFVQLQVSGGLPPYTYAVDFTPDGGSVIKCGTIRRTRHILPPRPRGHQRALGHHCHRFEQSGTPLKYYNTMTFNVDGGDEFTAQWNGRR